VDALDTEAAERFEALRAVRRELAAARSLPAYCVFSDAALRAIVEARPGDEEALAEVKGVGRKKAAQYAEAILRALR
jgi:ATP-dependent DNA helicase RecQ